MTARWHGIKLFTICINLIIHFLWNLAHFFLAAS